MRLSPHTAFHHCCSSFSYNNDLRPFLQSRYRPFLGSTSAFQHRFGRLYVSSAYSRMRESDTFPCSNDPIFAYTLRCLLWACQLESARHPCGFRTLWPFIVTIFTRPHWQRFFTPPAFLQGFPLDPYIRSFVRPLRSFSS